MSAIERGVTRTRASTLNCLARAFVKLRPDLGPSRPLARQLEHLAGTALAAEKFSSEWFAMRAPNEGNS